MFILLGPVELLFLLCCIASWTCLVVNVMVCVCSLRTILSVIRFDLFVLRVVNCLLNAFAISLGVVVECYCVVFGLRGFFVGKTTYGLPECVCVYLVIPCFV